MATGLKPRGEATVVDLDRLEPNPWNPNVQDEDEYRATRESLQEHGICQPLVVRTHPDDADRLQIIDGEHRLRAIRDEGGTEAPVWDLGEIEDAEARRLVAIFTVTRGEADTLDLSELLNLIADDYPDAPGTGLPYSVDELERLLSLEDFDWDEAFGGDGDGELPVAGEDGEVPDADLAVVGPFRLPPAEADAVHATLERAAGDGEDATLGDGLVAACEAWEAAHAAGEE